MTKRYGTKIPLHGYRNRKAKASFLEQAMLDYRDLLFATFTDYYKYMLAWK